ncbi:MAG: SCO family protein [Gammaproteobacteria bacterium]|nr:SCO family protein [Gammaproteobacteria bacterium]
MKKSKNSLLAIIAVIFLGITWFFIAEEPPILKLPNDWEGIIIESPPTPAPTFTFTQHNGKAFSEKDFLNKWSLIFFGYTNCPDVCPNAMRVFAQMAQDPKLPATEFIFATVDPKRDNTSRIAEFVNFFGKDFIGLTGDKKEIDKFARPFGVIYDYEGDVNSPDYIVTHFAAIYVIDPKARLRAYILPPHNKIRVQEAYELIRNYYE